MTIEEMRAEIRRLGEMMETQAADRTQRLSDETDLATTLKETTADLTQWAATMEAKARAHEEKVASAIAGLEGRLAAMETQVDRLLRTLGSLRTAPDVDRALTDLTKRITALELKAPLKPAPSTAPAGR